MFRFSRKNKTPTAKKDRAPRFNAAAIESLESRRLLSAAVATVQYDSKILRSSLSSNIQGYTPSEIRQAYGFDSVAFSTGSSTTANGAGQTIAIIDAYNDPNIVSDLGVFDSQFGLGAPPSFKVVNQTGGGTLPATDAGWAGEISLDVEWAHAIATGANILLVEAGSDNTDDLMAAVNYARHAAGVSVVSMSWGGPEFSAGFGSGTSQSQMSYASYFTTPAGHQGITFVAASGDGGSQGGVEWPASSPNVLSVGGATLTTSAAGAYASESSWADSTGGYSTIESEPAYQKAVQSTGMRSTPDVAYNASTSAGFAVYDSVPDQGYVGWQAVGGTSAGAPQWGALIAIADQGRVLAGKTSLDGATQTLPMLYALYGAPGTTGYTDYTSDFNDIIDSTSSAGSGGFGGFGRDPWGGGFGGHRGGSNTAAAA